MSRLWQSILSLWAWLVLVVCILLWFPLMLALLLVTAPFDRGRYITGYLFRRIGPVMATLNPLWRFRYSGRLPADPRRPYVVVSNHESFADILLISHLPWEMKWLSKAELFRIPVMGWLMWIAGDIPVKRGFGPSAAEAMERCREVLRRRVSVMIFPEGTPSGPRGRSSHSAARGLGHPDRVAQARLAVWPLGRGSAGARADRDNRTHAGRRAVAQSQGPRDHHSGPRRSGAFPKVDLHLSVRDHRALGPVPPLRPGPAASAGREA
jgi:1-acyl-sn-glycerol-3-phosphate acyltransferase